MAQRRSGLAKDYDGRCSITSKGEGSRSMSANGSTIPCQDRASPPRGYVVSSRTEIVEDDPQAERRFGLVRWGAGLWRLLEERRD